VKGEENRKKLPWEQEVAGSNPAAPTKFTEEFREYKKPRQSMLPGLFFIRYNLGEC